MRAAVYDRYGGPIKVRDVPAQTPKAGDVLVRVHAASVNSWDWDEFRGHPFARIVAPFRPAHPILGGDFAGIVEALGDGTDGFSVGQAVAGDLTANGWGGFGEFVAVPAAALVKVPAGVSMEEAAAVPQAGTLALQALRQREPVRAGERVLINGAGGGCGSFAIQLCKRMGAEVTAVDHGSKLDFMRSIGADHVLDYEREDFTASGIRYDRILDPVARRPLAHFRRALAPEGTLVVIGGGVRTLLAAGLASLRNKPQGQNLGLLIWRPVPAEFVELLDLVGSGAIRSVVDRAYRLEEAEAAIRRVGEGRSLGKVVVRVG